MSSTPTSIELTRNGIYSVAVVKDEEGREVFGVKTIGQSAVFEALGAWLLARARI